MFMTISTMHVVVVMAYARFKCMNGLEIVNHEMPPTAYVRTLTKPQTK